MKKIMTLMIAVLIFTGAIALFASCAPVENSENNTPDESVHKYGEWVVYKEATCEEDGYKSRICSECGASETETIKAIGHDYEEHVIAAPTCTASGTSEFVCKHDPNHRYTDTVKALGHDWKESEGYIAPTCTEAGYSTSATCSRCEEQREKTVIDPLGHDFSGEVTIEEATCEESGTKTTACARGCGTVETEEIEPLGHDFGEEKTVKEPTCISTGEKQSKCTRCEKTIVTELEALGHEWESGDVIRPATCEEDGLSASAICKRCHETQEQVVIPALGHNYGTTFYKSNPTCSKTGLAYKDCKRCDHREWITLETVDHEYIIAKYDKQPTCTQSGLVRYSCRYGCGNETEQQVAPALGHDWQETKIIKEPTCEQQGINEHFCLRCEMNVQYNIEPLKHNYEYRVDKLATETSTGLKTQHCTRCNSTGNSITIPVITENVEYEIRLKRSVDLEYVAADEVTYHVYNGETELFSFGAEGVTTTIELPKKANRLTVEGLRNGFTADQKDYTLNPGSPIVTIKLSAKVRTSSRVVDENGNKSQTKPEDEFIDEGDTMFDFCVRDTKHANDHSQDQWFSEVMKDKKLIMFDFFWTNCSSCATLMANFVEVYKHMLLPYKDDILVVMVDVMTDESDELIEQFRKYKGYPEEFLTCHGKEGSFDLLKWFQLEGHRVGIPMCIFVDGEGVVKKIGGLYSQKDFENFFTDFFKIDQTPINETEESEIQMEQTQNRDTFESLPVAICDSEKRRYE